jgi:hypothetical protein
MIEFSIDGNSFEIHPFTLESYYKVSKLILTEGKEWQLECISTLSGAPIEQIKRLKSWEWAQIWLAVEKQMVDDPSKPLMKTIHIDGVDYGLAHFDELTIGEIADIEALAHSADVNGQLHKMMSILYRPVVARYKDYYTIEKYTGSEDATPFMKMKLQDVNRTLSFFLLLCDYFIENMKESLNKTYPGQEKIINLSFEPLKWSLATGSIHSTSWQETMLSKLTELQSSLLEKPLTT